jgi:hypothetical protein
MTTSRFVDYLQRELFSKDPEAAESVQLEAWIHGPGIPDNAPRASSDAFAQVEGEAERFVAGGALPGGTSDWNPLQWIHFLRGLPRGLDGELLGSLDSAFSLTESENAEILCEWLKLAISSGYQPAYPRADTFLHRVGRRKFVQPIFEELVKTPDGKTRAKEIYATSRKTYHSMTTGTVDQILAG